MDTDRDASPCSPDGAAPPADDDTATAVPRRRGRVATTLEAAPAMSRGSTVERRARFDRQVLPHLDAAYRLAFALARSRIDAEDVVQEAMLRAYRGIDALRVENARPWLLAIVRNCFYDLSEQQAKRAAISLPEELGEEVGRAAATTEHGPEDATLEDERRTALGIALASLTAEHREVLILREIEDLDYHEIATVLDVPMGTVMSRLARARAAFRRRWLLGHGEGVP